MWSRLLNLRFHHSVRTIHFSYWPFEHISYKLNFSESNRLDGTWPNNLRIACLHHRMETSLHYCRKFHTNILFLCKYHIYEYAYRMRAPHDSADRSDRPTRPPVNPPCCTYVAIEWDIAALRFDGQRSYWPWPADIRPDIVACERDFGEASVSNLNFERTQRVLRWHLREQCRAERASAQVIEAKLSVLKERILYFFLMKRDNMYSHLPRHTFFGVKSQLWATRAGIGARSFQWQDGQ